MAVTYGFYNSSNGDRKYNALQFSRLFEGIIRDGGFLNCRRFFDGCCCVELNCKY